MKKLSLCCICILFIANVTCGTSDEEEFTNSWVVEIRGGDEEADSIAKEHGFVNKGQVVKLLVLSRNNTFLVMPSLMF